eukprot:2153065-Rhodomonas_salina.2
MRLLCYYVRDYHSECPSATHPCYAKSGTAIHTCYAKRSTATHYWYAKLGTEVACARDQNEDPIDNFQNRPSMLWQQRMQWPGELSEDFDEDEVPFSDLRAT